VEAELDTRDERQHQAIREDQGYTGRSGGGEVQRLGLRSADWTAARAAFESELGDTETAAALDGLARARWWLSDIPGAIEAWERAYTAYRKAGLDEPAGHVAILLSREHAEGLGNDALANGWLARARDLLDGQPDSIEWGWVALVVVERHPRIVQRPQDLVAAGIQPSQQRLPAGERRARPRRLPRPGGGLAACPSATSRW
jgi:hypothetical protein